MAHVSLVAVLCTVNTNELMISVPPYPPATLFDASNVQYSTTLPHKLVNKSNGPLTSN